MRWLSTLCALAAASCAVSCTPALNWREVTVDRLKVNLPCKPDRAQRPVTLQNTAIELDMAGCEASDALFAVSHIHAPATASVPELLGAWQSAALENLRVAESAGVISQYQKVQSAKPAAYINQVNALPVNGIDPNGKAVQAQFVWFVADRDLYHMAIYATRIRPEMTESLFGQAQLQ